MWKIKKKKDKNTAEHLRDHGADQMLLMQSMITMKENTGKRLYIKMQNFFSSNIFVQHDAVNKTHDQKRYI